jgi:uncharacterized GH25 family protein
MAGNTDEVLARMTGGHEIWLERTGSRAAAVELGITYGDAMRADGDLDPDMVSAIVISPDGGKTSPGLIRKDGQLIFSMPAGSPGYYISCASLHPVTISVLRDEGCRLGPRRMYQNVLYAGAYHQMAKIIIPCGDPGEYRPRHVHGIFDIVPDTATLRAGRTIGLTLLYEGRPVPDAGVSVLSKARGWCTGSGLSDKNGIVRLPVPEYGTFMFLAQYRDRSKSSDNEFDETIFITTLVMEANPV